MGETVKGWFATYITYGCTHVEDKSPDTTLNLTLDGESVGSYHITGDYRNNSGAYDQTSGLINDTYHPQFTNNRQRPRTQDNQTQDRASQQRAQSGPRYKTDGEASNAASQNGWSEDSGAGRSMGSKFFRDRNGNLWTRDRTGHNGGAWKKFDRSGTQRLGTYDENLNKIGP